MSTPASLLTSKASKWSCGRANVQPQSARAAISRRPATNHSLGKLPEPESTTRFLLTSLICFHLRTSYFLARFFDLKPTSYGALPFCVLCALAALRESRLPSPASEYMRQDGVVNPVP